MGTSVMARVWTIGDPEPEDHPEVVNVDEVGEWHYHWEAPRAENCWLSGWWCEETAGDLFLWEAILDESGVLTEVIDQD